VPVSEPAAGAAEEQQFELSEVGCTWPVLENIGSTLMASFH